MKRKALILLLAVVMAAFGMQGAHATTVDEMAKGILGADAVNDVLSSFDAQPQETEAAAEDAEAQPEETEPPAEAEEAEEEPEGVEEAIGSPTFQYTVAPVLPENQITPGGSFNLMMEPGQKQTIEVDIISQANADINVGIRTLAAFTNSNGTIQFEGMDNELSFKLSESVPVLISDILSTETDTITVKPGETVRVAFEIQMPEEPFDGVIMGGLSFLREPTDYERENSSMILNLFSYALTVRLRESEAPVEPAFTLIDISANNHTDWGDATFISIANDAPAHVESYTMKIAVYAAGDESAPVDEWEYVGLSFAPYSIMDFELMHAFPAGDYVLKADMTLPDETTYSLQKEFTAVSMDEETTESNA